MESQLKHLQVKSIIKLNDKEGILLIEFTQNNTYKIEQVLSFNIQPEKFQVQPSVDNEVAPILGDIVKNLVGSSGSSSSSVATKLTETTTASPTFAAADSFITNAIVQGASGPFSSALSSLANMITGTKTTK